MAISPSSGEFITLAEAQSYVFEYRKQFPTAIKGYFAGEEKLNMILEQEGCIGLRIYNGYGLEESKTNLVIVGVDGNERDMTSGLILEKTLGCPGVCDTTSALYS
jgi:hypothetical protein